MVGNSRIRVKKARHLSVCQTLRPHQYQELSISFFLFCQEPMLVQMVKVDAAIYVYLKGTVEPVCVPLDLVCSQMELAVVTVSIFILISVHIVIHTRGFCGQCRSRSDCTQCAV